MEESQFYLAEDEADVAERAGVRFHTCHADTAAISHLNFSKVLFMFLGA